MEIHTLNILPDSDQVFCYRYWLTERAVPSVFKTENELQEFKNQAIVNMRRHGIKDGATLLVKKFIPEFVQGEPLPTQYDGLYNALLWLHRTHIEANKDEVSRH